MISETQSKTPSNILILGKGYVGKWIYSFLSASNKTVLVSRSELDYHDAKTLSKYITIHNIDYIVNCSGFTGRPNVDEGEVKKEECWNLNVVVPQRVSLVCNMMGVKLIHISSGCIYSGYDKIFKEEDTPNFGLFDESSFYSKTKHAFETLTSDDWIKILRVRMPVCNDLQNPRNYLTKIMRYPNLVDYVNSKTYMPDLCGFVETLISDTTDEWKGQDIYNVVNGSPFSTREVIDIINSHGYNLTPNWVDMGELVITAPRSNCILDNSKASKIYTFKTEAEFLHELLQMQKYE